MIGNTLFKDDIAALNLINIIKNGKEDFVLATEIEGGCMPANLNFNEDGTFDLSFKMPSKILGQVGTDFFFYHHIMLLTKGIKLLIQNTDVKRFKQKITTKDDTYETNLTINSFRADIDDKLWLNSKQAAYCFWLDTDFHYNKIGVLFDMTTDENQESSWKNGLKLQIEENLFLLYFETDENKNHFFVLKSQKEINHEKFLTVLESVRVVLGLISGYYIADHVWYFAMTPNKKESITFRYENLNNSINNNYPLLDSAFYNDIDEMERKLKSQQFENLVSLFYKNQELRRSSQLLIQAGNVSGISKGCLASVAMETIKTKICKIKQNKEELISDKSINSKLKYELTKGLKKIKPLVSSEIFKRLESKIGQINQNSNAEKLEAPFEMLDLYLTDDEVYCLNCRNRLLHGATLIPKGELYSCLNQNELIEIVSNRLIMLTTMLLLKKCGYEGKVVDWGFTLVMKRRAVFAMKPIQNTGCHFRDLKDSMVEE